MTTKSAKAFFWQLTTPKRFLDFAISARGTRPSRPEEAGREGFPKEPGPADARGTPPIAQEKIRTPLGKPNWGINLDNAGPCRNAIVTILHSYEISTPNTYTLATNCLANYALICAVRYVNETYLQSTKNDFSRPWKQKWNINQYRSGKSERI